MNNLSWTNSSLWFKSAGIFFVAFLIGWLLRRLILSRLKKSAFVKDESIISVSVRILASHLPLWLALLGAMLALRAADATPKVIAAFDQTCVIFFILSVTVGLSSAAGSVVRIYAQMSILPVTSLTTSLIQLMVIGLGALVVLANLGIAITPLLTALGVGSLAVALALQETLANLFAGFYLMVSKAIRVGDYVKLSGENSEGYVTDIGWRSTQLQDLANNVVVIPNAKMAQSQVANFSQPDDEFIKFVTVLVGYGARLSKVEEVALEAARAAMKQCQPQIASGFEPRVRFLRMQETSFEMTVILKSRRYDEHFLLVHEFYKKLDAAFAEQGIEFAHRETRGFALGTLPLRRQ